MSKFTTVTQKALFSVMLLTSAFAFSNDVKEGENIKPGTRAMAHTEWREIQQARAEEEEKFPEAAAADAVEAPSEENGIQSAKPQAGVKAASGGVFFSSHTGAFHNPLVVSGFGDTVQLEDGSIWSVSASDAYKTLNWMTSDLIVITPNHEWFSSHLFRMTNQNTGVSIKVNMTLGPIYNGLYTHWIVSINYYTDEIVLEDGSIWQVTGFDSSTFSKWLPNDTVVIGVNDGFLSTSKPNILINVNTLTYVRAKCVW